MKYKLESRLQENINNFRYADDTTIMAESKEELKSPLMKVKKESEKAALKLNIQKTKIIASGPINSWQIEGGEVETVTFYFLVYLSPNYKAPKSLWTVTAAMKFKDTYSFENYDKPRCIKKQKHHFANKCPDSQSYGFSSSHEGI